jgi:hypothetical protein
MSLTLKLKTYSHHQASHGLEKSPKLDEYLSAKSADDKKGDKGEK